jgi:hypothetical protein
MPSLVSLVSKVRDRGVRGTASTVLNRAAQALAPKPLRPTVRLPDGRTEYVNWLTFAVPGMLSPGNVAAVNHVMTNLPKEGAIIEIGSFCGLSTCLISYFRQKLGVKNPFFTCDRWEFEGQQKGRTLGDSPTVTHDDYQKFVRESFLRDVQTFCAGDLPSTIELFSDDFFAAWNAGETRADVFGRTAKLGGPIAFSYIDGNHTYEFAKRDFENVDRSLVKGGFVLLDDSGDESGWGVCRVVDEIVAGGQYKIIANDPNYLFQKLS